MIPFQKYGLLPPTAPSPGKFLEFDIRTCSLVPYQIVSPRHHFNNFVYGRTTLLPSWSAFNAPDVLGSSWYNPDHWTCLQELFRVESQCILTAVSCPTAKIRSPSQLFPFPPIRLCNLKGLHCYLCLSIWIKRVGEKCWWVAWLINLLHFLFHQIASFLKWSISQPVIFCRRFKFAFKNTELTGS